MHHKIAFLAALALSASAVLATETSIDFEAGCRRLGQDSMGGVEVRGHALQASLVAQLPVTDVCRLYVRLGVNHVEVTARG